MEHYARHGAPMNVFDSKFSRLPMSALETELLETLSVQDNDHNNNTNNDSFRATSSKVESEVESERDPAALPDKSKTETDRVTHNDQNEPTQPTQRWLAEEDELERAQKRISNTWVERALAEVEAEDLAIFGSTDNRKTPLTKEDTEVDISDGRRRVEDTNRTPPSRVCPRNFADRR